MKDDELANPRVDVSRNPGTDAAPAGGSGLHASSEGAQERSGETDRQHGSGGRPRLDFGFFEPPGTGEGRFRLPSEPPADEPDSGLAPLSLSLIDPPRLLYERAHEPSEESPILYRERAFLVDNLQSDAELEEQLQAELASIRQDLQGRDASQYVQLALFDHEFEDQPSAPPVATLSWKDWQGRSEIWVRGVRRSSAPPADDGAADADDFEPASESLPLGSAPREGDSDPPAGEGPKKRSDSGTSWQAPSRSGEYPIPEAAELEGVTPSSQRVVAEEELVGALFERMHELLDAGTIGEGATFVRDIIAKYIPCDAALIHVFDDEAREFVLVRALGPNGLDVVGRRTKSGRSHLDEALQSQRTLELRPREAPASAEPWRAVGVDAAVALCSPVHRDGRHLGAIEVARGDTRSSFSEAEQHALEYICEMFADFALARPLASDAEAPA